MSAADSGQSKLTAIDLFSGAGGLTLGLKQAHFTVVGAIELNSVAAETYLENHDDVRLWEQDIRTVDPYEMMAELKLRPGELSLLAGCPPCQGFSTLRTKLRSGSVPDDRNDLVFEMARFARELMPRAVMLENVPNLAKDSRMALLIQELRDLGYHVGEDSVRVLDAADYGVPQRRRRMIMLAGRDGPLSFAPPANERRTVAWAIGGLALPGTGIDPLHDYHVRRNPRIEDLIRNVPKDGGSRRDLPVEMQLDCHRRSNGYFDVYGRMSWRLVAPTITSGCFNPSRGRFLHPQQDRAVTLREAALLQSFPKSYQFSLRRGREAAAAMIGNALPPEFVRRHALAVHKGLVDVGNEPTVSHRSHSFSKVPRQNHRPPRNSDVSKSGCGDCRVGVECLGC